MGMNVFFKRAIGLSFLCFAALFSVSQPYSKSFQAIKDATIKDYRRDRTNYGSCDNLITNYQDAFLEVNREKSRFLLQFDLSSLPSNIIIYNAYVELYLIGGDNNSEQINLREINKYWVEGSGGCSGASNNVTWLNTFTFSTFQYTWVNPGGDYSNSISGTTTVQNNGRYQWDVTALARGWYSNSNTNYGIILMKANENAQIEKIFASREHSNPAYRPKLVVNYVLPLEAFLTKKDVYCPNHSDGSIDLTVSEGYPPYSYNWSNLGNNPPNSDPQDVNGLPSGNYTVTVQDFLGNTTTRSVSIDPISISPDKDIDRVSDDCDCDEDNDGILDGDEVACSEVEAFWTLDNTSNDFSGNNHNASSSSNFPSYTIEAIQGTHSANFNGTSNVIVYSGRTFMKEEAERLSFSAWIKPSNLNGQRVIFEQGGSQNGFTVWLNGNIPTLSVKSSNNKVEVSSGVGLLVDDKWYHIAATFNKGTLTIYVDGISKVAIASFAKILAGVGDGGIGGVLSGSSAAGVNGFYAGLMDGVKYHKNISWESTEIDYNCDLDQDGIVNRQDLDSDGDGITDIIESQPSGNLIVPNGYDDNIDGIDNAFDPNKGNSPTITVDTDNDGIPDFLDLDSDNDFDEDLVEAWDLDNNRVADVFPSNTDTDNDGIDNQYDLLVLNAGNSIQNITNASQSSSYFPNIDLGGNERDWREIYDTDQDGVADVFDPDDDNDGVLDADEANCVIAEAYWTLDNTTNDVSANGNNASNTSNAPSYTTEAIQGTYSANFNGTSNIIQYSRDADGFMESTYQKISFSAWLKPNKTKGKRVIYEEGGTYNGIALWLNNGVPTFTIRVGGQSNQIDLESTKTLVGDGHWYNLAATFDRGKMVIYVDGLSTELNTNFQQIPAHIDDGGIGGPLGSGNASEVTGYYSGLMDAVKYSTILAWDSLELDYNCDLDGDKVANKRDLDSDNDGLADIIETGGLDINNSGRGNSTDSDQDGLLNQFDLSNGGVKLIPLDLDSDGLHNLHDLDSDGDGMADITEAEGIDVNGDGLADGLFTDTDSDGWSNKFDSDNGGNALLNPDTDADGVYNANDSDSDNDGILDIIESQAFANVTLPSGNDNDRDGIDNSFDLDQSNRFITPIDNDQDGIVNYLDLDSDNDGLADIIEVGGSDNDNNGLGSGGDDDQDGLLNIFDLDNSNSPLNPTDFDADGTPNYLDLDSDNDGLADIIEAWGVDNDENGVGHSGDSDQDGLLNVFDSNANGTLLGAPDADNDGLMNALDLDSDADGIADIIEARGVDADGNGIVDGSFADNDGDGWSDVFDSDNGGSALENPDTDGDSYYNVYDLDSDNDGISDVMESQLPSANVIISGNDSDQDGIADNFDPDLNNNLTVPTDNDGDNTEDYLDLDSDNDGIADIIEASGADNNNDGRGDTNQDSDRDGLLNLFDADQNGSPLYPTDFDGDSYQDYIDLDSDNDGIVDLIEARGTDLNSDGKGDGTDLDNDGLLDVFDVDQSGMLIIPFDTDGDGQDNETDLDSDADGIADIIEARGVDADGNGMVDGLYTDTDSDGWSDVFDSDNGGGALENPDTDGDSFYNVYDIDSDNDGILDVIESQLPATSIITSGNDFDQDGIADSFDPDLNNNLTVPTDNDGDNTEDYIDLDSDNDGIADIIEASGADNNNDGRGDSNQDTDQDGLLNLFDTDQNGSLLYPTDFDGDSYQDYIDLDSDNDGIVDVLEAGGTDANQDGKGDGTDSDNDGLLDVFDVDQSGVLLIPIDSDKDGLDNETDLDSDNDGIADIIESTGTDSNKDGLGDDTQDSDMDGLLNLFDVDQSGSPLTPTDFDGDGFHDYVDLDSDNDGLVDIFEAGGIDSNGDGKGDGSDTDQDGLLDVFDLDQSGQLLNPKDKDDDGVDNETDLDSDNDGIADIIEAGGIDADGNGMVDGLYTDTDNDGWSDTFDPDNGGNALPNPDTDGDNYYNVYDIDSDNDGLLDIFESQFPTAALIFPNYDSDQDGIADNFDPDLNNSLTVPADNDGDNIEDYIDLDSDNDGLADLIEVTGTDSNNDGKGDDNQDWNRDGLLNIFEAGNTRLNLIDVDGDGLYDYIDIDSDNDGIVDVVEVGGMDSNHDGKGDGSDSDNDGLLDVFDADQSGALLIPIDTDQDGLDNGIDLDSDNDGIADILEAGGIDLDSNGLVDGPSIDTDKDGWDNIFDSDDGGHALANPDSDSDGVYDIYDLDSDNDGIVDLIEAGGIDSDADGKGDGNDTDNDGILDVFDTDQSGKLIIPFDTDMDSLINGTDLDSDNDGIADIVEARGVDTDNDGKGDLLDSDGDGLLNTFDITNGGSPLALIDFDGDGVSDLLDLDSDNDGIPDILEALGIDNNQDGMGDSPDSDHDGLLDVFDSDQAGNILPFKDTDGDGLANSNDLDSDGDGMADIFEDGGTDADGNGLLDGNFKDSNQDGWSDAYTSKTGTKSSLTLDSDGDGFLNSHDIDSDNDGILDVIETQLKSVLILPANSDVDSDGIDDSFDQDQSNSFIVPQDNDLDGVKNHLDVDSDNDGVPDLLENGGVDSDHNGRVDSNTDTDGDGFPDIFDTDNGGNQLTVGDLDSDGIENYLDIDADGDGLTDNLESQSTLAFVPANTIDNDKDGWSDAYDTDQGGTGFSLSDIDLDGSPDFLDTDTDGDGALDWLEGFDSDNSKDALYDLMDRATAFELLAANPSKYINSDDSDGDNIPNWLEDDDQDNIPNFLDPDHVLYFDTDQDGLIDLYDTDNFGAPSDTPDLDFDGEYDFRDSDDLITLPIELIHFTASLNEGKVELSWATESEINNDYFEILKSIDGSNFKRIAWIKGAGNSYNRIDYKAEDSNPQIGNNYYQLVQHDFNGQTSYSQIEVVPFHNISSKIKIYPNPGTGKVLNLEVANPIGGAYKIELLNLDGSLILDYKVTISRESKKFEKELLNGIHLAKGSYLIQVSSKRQSFLLKYVVN